MLIGLIGYGVRSAERRQPLNVERLLENREHGQAADVFTSLVGIRRGLAQWPADPVALTALGMVMLLITPVFAVAVMLPAFARHGDLRYASISAALLAALVLSFFFGNG